MDPALERFPCVPARAFVHKVQPITIRSIRFDPKAPVDPEAPTTAHEWFVDRTGALSAGFWASQAFSTEVSYDEDEVCTILEGKVELTDSTGHMETYGPGDTFVIPAGFKGVWTSVEPVRKFYVVHLPKGTAGG